MNDSNSMLAWILVPLALVAGVVGTRMTLEPELPLPDRALVVHVQNRTSETLPKVNLHYANVNTQQETNILQLRPGETRTVTLNHEPGLGYTVRVPMPDGRTLEVCGGRAKDTRVMREVITPDSILSGTGKP
ncbi:hypothetical protein [Ectothiorhodospira mobilis]|nr:hypothetical protein [Ectothiorhodospira mobilis]